MLEKLFYFRYKNGKGDCFEPLATWETGHLPKKKKEKVEKFIRELENTKQRLLYVGFDNGETHGGTIHRVNGSLDGSGSPSFDEIKEAGAKYRDDDPKFTGNASLVRDDDFIAWLAHPNHRERIRLITFSAGHLYFWKVEGKTLDIIHEGEDRYETVKAMDITKRTEPLPMYKFLPVNFIGKVRRQDLYTSIDSLAVLQYLTRGTCRPLWKVKGSIPWIEDTEERQSKFPYLEPERKTLVGDAKDPARVPAPTKEGKEEEQLFGTFIRKYLDAVLNGDEFFKNMEPNQRRSLVIHTMNPILVETCAYYFCLDLGRDDSAFNLLADVGKGKGLDVIDVRARLHPPARNDDDPRIKKIAEKLEDCNLEKAARHFRETKILELQCKAHATTDIPGLEHVVLFVNGHKNGESAPKRPVLDIQKFLTKVDLENEWPLVYGFLMMQVHMLQNIPKAK